jgi:plasmid stabilization system protein ParE
MRNLNFTDDADRNLIDIALYIATKSQSRAIALAFVERLRAKCRDLAALPGTLGTHRPELRENIRSTPSNGYVIFFRFRRDVLEVVNVLHASRDVIRHFGG